MRNVKIGRVVLLLGGILLATAGSATATLWGGYNGQVRLSFSNGDSLTSVADINPDANGLILVDLYAVLEKVDSVVWYGERFMGIGGFELSLLIEGADAIVIAQDFPFQQINLGKQLGQCIVGVYPSQALSKGRAELAHWQILIRGEARNVAFRLDPEGLFSCKRLVGCTEANTPATFNGTVAAEQHGLIFSAGFVPAYLNWTGDPDLTPVSGEPGWRDLGLFSE